MQKPNRWTILVLVLCFVGGLATAQEQSAQSIRKAVREYRQNHEADIVRSYAQLLSLPNVASDTANITRNADAISKMLEQRGFHT
ncbi:MAG TPA: hypothetical protein VGH51_11485, partial [Candidatus Angelobacter sp.]